MLRAIYFIFLTIIPVIFGWWIFLPLSVLLVYLAVLPYEIILAAMVLDSLYYFGSGFLYKYPMTIFALGLLFIALFLNTRIHWRKLV